MCAAAAALVVGMLAISLQDDGRERRSESLLSIGGGGFSDWITHLRGRGGAVRVDGLASASPRRDSAPAAPSGAWPSTASRSALESSEQDRFTAPGQKGGSASKMVGSGSGAGNSWMRRMEDRMVYGTAPASPSAPAAGQLSAAGKDAHHAAMPLHAASASAHGMAHQARLLPLFKSASPPPVVTLSAAPEVAEEGSLVAPKPMEQAASKPTQGVGLAGLIVPASPAAPRALVRVGPRTPAAAQQLTSVEGGDTAGLLKRIAAEFSPHALDDDFDGALTGNT